MKKSPILIALTMLLSVAIPGFAENEPDSLDSFLPIGLTDYEKQHLDQIGVNHRATAAPTGVIRNPAEWEPSQGVIIRWPLGIPVSLVADMSTDVMVTTIVSSSSTESSARSYYTAYGVNMSNVNFLIASTNSIWTRDYGPWFIFNDGQPGIVDHIYNRPRPLDDLIPQILGADWGIPVYGIDLIATGGNHMSDGLGMSMSTRLIYDENPGKTTDQVDSLINAYLGNDFTVLNYIESGGIHHIDCWAKFLNPTTILVKDVPSSSSSYALLNARAEQLSQQISAWGQPYTIVRVYCPYGTAYTNSIILNKRVYVPIFSSSYDATALQTYRDAMPGYEIRGYTGSWLDDDAIHCRAMGVPDQQMLFVNHIPLTGAQPGGNSYPVSVHIEPYSGMGLIPDSTKVLYSVDGGDYQSILLSSTEVADSFYCEIPALPSGSEVSYYIKAADSSGRVETHPFVGEPWAHSFFVNSPPTITGAGSFICKADSYFGYYPDYTDPDSDAVTISYSNQPAWLTASGDSLVGTAPHERQSYSFDIVVADQYAGDSMTIALSVYICGDINGDGAGPDVTDLTYFVDYLFNGGAEPPDIVAADVDGSGELDITDLTTFVEFLFGGGPPPVCR